MDRLIHENKVFDKVVYAGKEVKGREFDNCTFKNCDFSDSNFSKNRFTNCSFTGCNLSLVKLNQSTLDTVVFTECKLLGINFSETADFLFTVHFENCILDYASFMNKKMGKTKFRNSSLKNVVFTDAVLSQVLFENTNLEGANFNRTNLQGANFLTAYNYSIDPEINNIKKARFSRQGISGLLDKYDIIIE